MAGEKNRQGLVAANASDYIPAFEPVKRGTLNLGAQQIKTKNQNGDEIWFGTIDLNGDEDVSVYLRVSTPHAVMTELVCAVLGRAVGLPVPMPFIVTVDRKKLPRSKLWASGENQRIAFASQAIENSGTFAQLLDTNSSYAKKLLRQWNQYPEAAIFDEWLANVDRNYSNMLFRSNVIWLIDHAEAFGGTLSRLFPLEELADKSFKNQLLDDCQSDFDLQRRNEIIEIAKEVLKVIKEFDLTLALHTVGHENIFASGGPAEVLHFLQTRLEHTLPLLCNRLGFPQLPPTPTPRSPALGQSASAQ